MLSCLTTLHALISFWDVFPTQCFPSLVNFPPAGARSETIQTSTGWKYSDPIITVLEKSFFDLFSNSEESIRHGLPDSLFRTDRLFPLDTVTAHNEGVDDNCYSTTTEDADFSTF